MRCAVWSIFCSSQVHHCPDQKYLNRHSTVVLVLKQHRMGREMTNPGEKAPLSGEPIRPAVEFAPKCPLLMFSALS
uniref:Secreted protein n=1 Tax=Ascaris lumbricoides TaxID=6252 RepID=A0A0M3HST9_ASCLU